jgi:hypothetical protein
MKFTFLCSLCLFACFISWAQATPKTENIFIITTDGFRWQEIFTGADPALLGNSQYVADTSLLRQQYWDPDPNVRRSRLMPFFWNVIARSGQLYGNRLLGNKVDVSNWYKISYPGYSEIFTGYADPRIIINLPRNNRNGNILEWLNALPGWAGSVVAFSSWNLFPYILNAGRSRLPINSGYESQESVDDSVIDQISQVQESVQPKGHCRQDWLTFLNAREYIARNHPRVVFIGLGETDEFAHAHRYDLYLQQASALDQMIADLWYFVQTQPFYKDKTAFIITTDHGRGKTPNSWPHHGFLTPGSSQTWLALLGPGILPVGELREPGQFFERQLASTIAQWVGLPYRPGHAVGKPLLLPQDFLEPVPAQGITAATR